MTRHRPIRFPRPVLLLAFAAALFTLTATAADLPARPFLGVTPAPAAEGSEPGTPPEPVLGSVLPGGSGAALGLEPGDRIESINETAVDSFPALVQVIGQFAVGDELTVAIVRDHEPTTLTGTLQGRPLAIRRLLARRHLHDGVPAQDLFADPELARVSTGSGGLRAGKSPKGVG